jgi:hypothetical protein
MPSRCNTLSQGLIGALPGIQTRGMVSADNVSLHCKRTSSGLLRRLEGTGCFVSLSRDARDAAGDAGIADRSSSSTKNQGSLSRIVRAMPGAMFSSRLQLVLISCLALDKEARRSQL